MPLKDRPVLGGVLDRVLDRVKANRPLAGAIAEGILNAARRTDTPITKDQTDTIVDEVQRSIATNPVASSAVSAEPWWQNRVRVGLLITGFGAVLKLFDIDPLSDEDKELWTTIIMAFGAVIATIGEWLSKWLAGVDWKRPWTLLGIGR